MPSDIFDTYEIEGVSDIFDEFDVSHPEETTLQAAKRHTLRSASRVGETVAGMPGDIASLVTLPLELVNRHVEGKMTPEQLANVEAERTKLKDFREKMLFEYGIGDDDFMPMSMPTSSELKDTMSYLTDGYLDPQSGGEEFADELIGDATALLIGRKIPTKGGFISRTFKTIAKPFLVALGANVAKEGAAAMGASEGVQTATKLGTMLLLDLVGKKSANTLKKELYKDAEVLLPEGASVSAENLSRNLAALEKRLKVGGATPSKTPVLTKLKELQAKIVDGRISMEELQEFKRDINEVSSSLYDLPKDVKGKLKKNFNDLRDGVKGAISEYGTQNPEWLNVWQKAEEVHSAVAQSTKVRANVQNMVKKYPHLSATVLGLFGLSIGSTGAYVALPAAAAVYTTELVTRIMKSPTLRKLYRNTITAATAENIPVMTKNMLELDKELKRQNMDFDLR